MKPDGKIVFCHLLVKRFELGRIQRLTRYAAVYLHALQSQLPERPIRLFQSGVYIIHGKTCSCSEEFVWIFDQKLGEFIVGNPCQFDCIFGPDKFLQRHLGHRQDLQHIGKPVHES